RNGVRRDDKTKYLIGDRTVTLPLAGRKDFGFLCARRRRSPGGHRLSWRSGVLKAPAALFRCAARARRTPAARRHNSDSEQLGPGDAGAGAESLRRTDAE